MTQPTAACESSSLSVRWLPTGSSISGFEFSTSAVLMSFCASSTDGSVPTIVQMRSRVIGMTSSMAEMRMRVLDASLILLSTEPALPITCPVSFSGIRIFSTTVSPLRCTSGASPSLTLPVSSTAVRFRKSSSPSAASLSIQASVLSLCLTGRGRRRVEAAVET